jgi:hypothetical protein
MNELNVPIKRYIGLKCKPDLCSLSKKKKVIKIVEVKGMGKGISGIQK